MEELIDSLKIVQVQTISFFVVFLLGIVFVIAVNISLKKQSPLKATKGIAWIAESFVGWIDGSLLEVLPKTWKKNFGPYLGAQVWIIFFGTIIGLTGLPAATSSFSITLMLALITFVMIHVTAARKNGLGYFKRFLEPFPVFLPVNLLAMWAPLISLSARLFANVLSGAILIGLVYTGLSGIVYGAITPIVAVPLHLYFDLFVGAIQALVFMSLTLLLIQQEIPDDEEEVKEVKVKKEKIIAVKETA